MAKFKNIFANSERPGSLGNYFRNRRFSLLQGILDKLPKPIKILDVGGTKSIWENRGLAGDENYQITLLNLNIVPTDYNNITSIKGNATDLSEFEEDSFDLVFSNSVIEHVYNWENQNKMAREIIRVGVHFAVQTPNKYFFIEPHYLLPYFQYLPNKFRYFVLTKTRLSRLKKWDKGDARQYLEEIRLISHREMKALFPESKIYYERFLGMKKSFIAHNFILE